MKNTTLKEVNTIKSLISMKTIILFLLLSGSLLQAASCPDYKRVFDNKAIISTGVWIDADETTAIDSATTMALKGIPLQAIDFLKTEHTTLYNDNIDRMIMSKASEIIHGYKVLSKEWDANTSIAEVVVQQDGRIFSKEICSEIASNPNPSETVSEVTAAETAAEVSTTAAATSGLSSTTLWVAGGVALAAGAGVAIAAGGSDDDDDHHDDGGAPVTTIGLENQTYRLTDSNNAGWSAFVHYEQYSECTYEEYYNNGYSGQGTCTWSLSNDYYTFLSDGGAELSGTVSGNLNSFTVTGYYSGGTPATVVHTKQ